MSEKEIIKGIEYAIRTHDKKNWCDVGLKTLQGLLDLYKTQKEELEYYKQKEKDEFEERDRWE